MTTVQTPRTGQQFSIHYGDYEAVITELGAALRVLKYQGKDVVVPTDANELANCCQGQILVPFPNRIEGGTYEFNGKQYDLPIDEHERNNAIHGYGYRAYWKLVALTESAVDLTWRMPNLEGYPFDITVVASYELKADGLHLTIKVTNNDTKPAPWALAIHPWLANGITNYGDAIDADNAQCTLQIPAATHVTVNENLIPTGTEAVDGTKYDFREGLQLTQQPYDDALTDVEHDADGWTTALFTRTDGLVTRVAGDKTITSFQVCTGTGFPAEKHPAGVAVEPQTAYANAFNTKKDLIELAAGQSSETHLQIGIVEGAR
ncbi:aldose epimerase [Bifidobacterium dolichotidis]|uniref:Aldose epimerase n=1 Tax=Bifidobacterium dolichotidis TaxID=2306976 RepID=A0A430FS79_9BIFI|nr:aldose 1-epimerase family protein [Bifidobacterium dolichotidis]RSX55718.1 aldose epimerase [Bifidobacterium dolichotidis]